MDLRRRDKPALIVYTETFLSLTVQHVLRSVFVVVREGVRNVLRVKGV